MSASLIGRLADRLGAHFVIGQDEPPVLGLDVEGIIELADAAEARLAASRPAADTGGASDE